MNYIALLKACKDAGVREFQLGELRIVFGQSPAEPLEDYQKADTLNEEGAALPENDGQIGPLDEARLRDMQTAEMMLLDPDKYERLQMGEEL